MKTLTCFAITVLGFLGPAQAVADPRTHDGFFLRGAASYAPLSDGIRGKSDSTVFGSDSNATGQGVLFEALAGGTTKPTGLLSAGKMVYGGGMLFATLPSFTLTANGVDVPANLANAFGVFFYSEVFPVAEGGVGVQSMLGLAHLSFGLSDGTAQSANGALLGLGFTQSAWVSDEWSIGLQVRAIAMLAGGSSDGVRQSHIAWLPSLGLVATYH